MDDKERKVSEEFVWKLIGEVKEVNKEVSSDIKAQSDAIVDLVNIFRKRFDGEPKLSEVKNVVDYNREKLVEKFKECKEANLEIYKLLKEHCNHADVCLTNIDQTLGEDDISFKSILDSLESIKKRVTTMIIVVAVAFSLISISYFFVRSVVDTTIKKEVEKIEQEEKSELRQDMKRIEDLIKRHIKEGK